MKVSAVLETCLYCADLEAADTFYRQVLGLDRVGYLAGRHSFYRCGSQMVLLFNPEATSRLDAPGELPKVPLHGAFGPGHLAFRVPEEELAAWRERLLAFNVAVESEITWPHGGRSIYFRDPAGNSLELSTGATWGL